MLIYEYRIRDEFERVKSYAARVRQAFEADRPSDDLLADAQNLAALFENLRSMLPEGLRDVSNFSRHIGWMRGNLKRNAAKSSRSDIDDICNHDIPTLEKAFVQWCASAEHYDRELAEKIGDLIVRQEFDSAVRKAFVLLKSRLVTKFSLPDDLDGVNLINRIFGNNGHFFLFLNQLNVRRCGTYWLDCMECFGINVLTLINLFLGMRQMLYSRWSILR